MQTVGDDWRYSHSALRRPQARIISKYVPDKPIVFNRWDDFSAVLVLRFRYVEDIEHRRNGQKY
jgi:hypothetical protein